MGFHCSLRVHWCACVQPGVHVHWTSGLLHLGNADGRLGPTGHSWPLVRGREGEGVVAGPAWDPGVRGCVRGREGGFANLGPGLELDTESNMCKGLTDHIIHVKLEQKKRKLMLGRKPLKTSGRTVGSAAEWSARWVRPGMQARGIPLFLLPLLLLCLMHCTQSMQNTIQLTARSNCLERHL